MSITPTAISVSAPPRPHAGALGSFRACSFGGSWVSGDHMSIEHDTTVGTNGSKRLRPGSFVGVLT